MPWNIEKITEGKNKGKFRVKNTLTGAIRAKATTKQDAEAQIRLLQGIKHGTIKGG